MVTVCPWRDTRLQCDLATRSETEHSLARTPQRGEIHLPKLDCDYDRDILTPVVQHLLLRNPGMLLVAADRQHVAHSRGVQEPRS